MRESKFFWVEPYVTLAALAFILAMIAFAACGRSEPPTRVVCFAGERAIYDAIVPSGDVSFCRWDWGHNGVCVRTVSGKLMFGPAHACTLQQNPPSPAPQPQPTEQATNAPTPTQVPAAKRAR